MDLSRLRVFDNGGETMDQYSVVIMDHRVDGTSDVLRYCLGMSSMPDHPQGFSQLSTVYSGFIDRLGNEVEFSELPKRVRKHVIDRLADYTVSYYNADDPEADSTETLELPDLLKEYPHFKAFESVLATADFRHLEWRDGPERVVISCR